MYLMSKNVAFATRIMSREDPARMTERFQGRAYTWLVGGTLNERSREHVSDTLSIKECSQVIKHRVSSHQAEIVVDEDKFEKKRREKLEDLREAEENRQWRTLKLSHIRTGKRKRKANQESICDGWREPDKKSVKKMIVK